LNRHVQLLPLRV
jgi:hypothetical protein